MAKQKKQQYSGIVYSTDENYAYMSNGEEGQETLAPNKQQLKVSLDKKQRAGKAVTLISGFFGKEEDLADLGKLLKQRCGVGGSVKDGEILIQGDFRVKIVALLTEKGYRVKQVGG